MKLRELRKKKNIKKAALGSMVGVSGAAISDYERGISEPNVDKLLRFADIFEVSVEELLGSDAKYVQDEPGVFVTGNISAVKSVFAELYVEVPFLSAKAQAGLPYISYDYSDVKWITETYPVFMPLVNITDKHIAIEVQGDSMVPEIKSGAIVLVESISGNDWRYESGGVYAVLYGPGRLVVKRIKTNEMQTEKVLRLHSDNPQHGVITVEANEIHRMWKVLLKVAEVVR